MLQKQPPKPKGPPLLGEPILVISANVAKIENLACLHQLNGRHKFICLFLKILTNVWN